MRRETRAKRKRLPKRDEITAPIYKKLIQAIQKRRISKAIKQLMEV